MHTILLAYFNQHGEGQSSKHTKGSPVKPSPTPTPLSLSVTASRLSAKSWKLTQPPQMMSLGSSQSRGHRNDRHSTNPHVLQWDNYKCILQHSSEDWATIPHSGSQLGNSGNYLFPFFPLPLLPNLGFLWSATQWTSFSLILVPDLAFEETQTKIDKMQPKRASFFKTGWINAYQVPLSEHRQQRTRIFVLIEPSEMLNPQVRDKERSKYHREEQIRIPSGKTLKQVIKS